MSLAARFASLGSLCLWFTAAAMAGDGPGEEFFEKEVRPLLVARCQSCHGEAKQKGGLRLDSLPSALAGGGTGPAVVPGKPAESLLVDAIRYGELYQMPPKSRLPEAEVATLTRWVEMGAPWPASVAAAAKPSNHFDLTERARHWSFQPVRLAEPPRVADEAWPTGEIDRFLLSRLEAKGLKPAPDAGRVTLIRRTTFDLTGLPPTPAEVDAFMADMAPDAFAKVVDRLLDSPHYGERWARHWLDLVRFAETAGHEFDYDHLDAWRYRDYVIRAFNADVPYDRFVVEHLAGDLVPDPRRDPANGADESILATGFFLLGEGTHSPVDVREEQMRRVSDQVDVISKAFLGLTVACARCHDHKFDAISTRDYYALAGYLASSRHQHAPIDKRAEIAAKAAELRSIKSQFTEALPKRTSPETVAAPAADGSILFEDFGTPGFAGWTATGQAFGDGPSQPGAFRPNTVAEGPVGWEIPAGQAHSGLIADRLQGVLRSRTFSIGAKYVHVLAAGKGGRINFVIDGFEKIRSPIYGGLTMGIDAGDTPRWYSMKLEAWNGQRAYIELADGGTVIYEAAIPFYSNGDGYLAVDEIRFSDSATPPVITGRVPVAIDGRRDGDLDRRYVALASSVPAPEYAPALLDGDGEDERVHIRGSHKTLGPEVPRRSLEAFSGVDQPHPDKGSGRLELARRVASADNPLLARVMVNRLWQHHFGEGLVRSVDDFGKMGQAPSHPELLDWLASRFVEGGWSVKAMHRLILTSRAYRMSSQIDPASEPERIDPSNILLHRANLRRLESESIRDAILACSGSLKGDMFGPSVPVHLTEFMDGRGRPGSSGPIDGDGRRSIYQNVRRNFLAPLLTAFDSPPPASPMGRRNVSNVPAQALTMLNDPFVLGQAKLWAERVLAAGPRTSEARVELLYRTAFGRSPTADERAAALAFVQGAEDDAGAWGDLCHVLFNVKEFVFVD
ncbi:PSD1 and planctomycete cytochrome C domain-containing protein [Isosphaeraceae bacterium EP7]